MASRQLRARIQPPQPLRRYGIGLKIENATPDEQRMTSPIVEWAISERPIAYPDALAVMQERAGAIADGSLVLAPGADPQATITRLCAVPGIGDWTAQYIAMRALRWPDAFPAGDVALHKALGVQETKNPARAAETASTCIAGSMATCRRVRC